MGISYHDKPSSSTCKCSSACTFLRCLAKKTERQIVINGALHFADYVTKVMNRLSDQGVFPQVVLKSELSLHYCSSYVYGIMNLLQLLNGCGLNPFPPPKEATHLQNEAKNTETMWRQWCHNRKVRPADSTLSTAETYIKSEGAFQQEHTNMIRLTFVRTIV